MNIEKQAQAKSFFKAIWHAIRVDDVFEDIRNTFFTKNDKDIYSLSTYSVAGLAPKEFDVSGSESS